MNQFASPLIGLRYVQPLIPDSIAEDIVASYHEWSCNWENEWISERMDDDKPSLWKELDKLSGVK